MLFGTFLVFFGFLSRKGGNILRRPSLQKGVST